MEDPAPDSGTAYREDTSSGGNVPKEDPVEEKKTKDNTTSPPPEDEVEGNSPHSSNSSNRGEYGEGAPAPVIPMNGGHSTRQVSADEEAPRAEVHNNTTTSVSAPEAPAGANKNTDDAVTKKEERDAEHNSMDDADPETNIPNGQEDSSMKPENPPPVNEVRPLETSDADEPPVKKQKTEDGGAEAEESVEEAAASMLDEQKDSPPSVEETDTPPEPADDKGDKMEVDSMDTENKSPEEPAQDTNNTADSGRETEEPDQSAQDGSIEHKEDMSTAVSADDGDAAKAIVADGPHDSKLDEKATPTESIEEPIVEEFAEEASANKRKDATDATENANDGEPIVKVDKVSAPLVSKGEGSAIGAETPETAPLNIENATGKMKHDDNTGDSKVDFPESKTEADLVVGGSPTPSTGDGASGEKKSAKHVRSKHVDPQILGLRRRIQGACRDNDLESAMKAYEKAVTDNIRLEAQSFYNLLNLCDGLERSVHVGTPKCDGGASSPKVPPAEDDTIDNKKRQEYAFRLKDHMMQLNIPLNETAYTAIIKVLVRNKEYAKAEEVIDESKTVQQCKPKLRLFSPLLTAYCEERQMIDALKCWLRIYSNKLELMERELLSLMKCAIATGDVHVFDRVLSDVAEAVAVPSKDTVSRILEWYESPHATVHTESIRIPKHADEIQVQSLLQEIHKDEVERPPSMGPVQTANGWNVSSAVPIDTESGKLKDGCLQDCALLPVSISARAWEEMMMMNESIVLEGQVEGNTSEFQGGRKGKMRTDFDPQERKESWKHFTDFLESMGPIDVVIDSANVGYFKQNFASAPKHVDYDQIDWVARRFLAMGKKVLLVLHQRHFAPNLMPENFKPLQEKWENMGILYKTPAGMNDDWFWLHAALKHKTLVLTNDEMRDHHFQMLAPRTFLRWKERHQVHFSFGDWESSDQDGSGNSASRGRTVELEFPAPYSRRVQRVEDGLVVPLIKKGDENRFLDGTHVAEADEPEEETYLCIRAVE